jgi:hypothetical protein
MKRLFTLVALMAMVLGASAKWSDEPVYKINYSTYQSFPFYVMAYAPSFDGTAMIDAPTTQKLWRGTENDYPGDEAMSGEVTVNGTAFKVQELGENQWRQYFIADGIPTLLDGRYKVVAHVKASAAVNINVNMGWGWGSGEQAGTSVAIPDGSAGFQEVTWEYSGINGTSCNLVAQPGGSTETIEWLSLEVYEWQKEGQRPKIWLQDIVNGNAETEWTEEQKAIKFNDQEQNYTICAWSKEKGRNVDETADGQPWNPFPADIEVDPKDPNNHVFVCHGQPATTDGGASAWDNQFWIQSQHSWPSGTTLKIKFRYMASADVSSTDTQVHKQNPSDYLIWHAIGNIHFTEEWQNFDGTMSIADDMAGGWSIAFNLNSVVKDAVNFYFDDLSWEYLQLDEGYFLSGINATTTTSYDDLDNAIQFEDGINFEGDECLIATFGTSGDANTYVDQVMISTKRGDDQAFKGATLKPESNPKTTTPDDWITYAPSTNAKIDLPGLGVWKVYLDTEYSTMAFEMLEGTAYELPDPVDVFTYTDEIVVNGKEREDLKDEWSNNELKVREEADNNPDDEHGLGGDGHNGQTWDNQFFIKANHALEKGTVTKLVFKYKSSVAEAKTTTQCHGENPGAYMHWAAIGDVNFTDEWQDFEQEFTVPNEADGMWNIAFNMAEIKGACDYSIKDVQWYLYDSSLEAGQTYENLISGATNFYKKEGANTDPYTGIENVIINTGKTSSAIYNLAGQKVNKNYKGILVKDGKKFVNK